jgi:hypothetical protein
MNLEGFQCCKHVVNAVNAAVYLVFYNLLKCVYSRSILSSLNALMCVICPIGICYM